MQVTADVADWTWLSSIACSDHLVDELFEGADRKEIVESCYSFNPQWNDSATMYFELALAVKELLTHESPALKLQVEKGIYPLISENQTTDELGLFAKTDGC